MNADSGSNPVRLGIVASRFNDGICERLLAGARAECERQGVVIAALERVPGALEIPLVLRWLAESGRVDALVAIGVVVRGETFHFEIVSLESARGVAAVAEATGVPVANAILTTEDEAQAEARIGKGEEAVRVALEMARLRAKIAPRAPSSGRA